MQLYFLQYLFVITCIQRGVCNKLTFLLMLHVLEDP